MNGRNLADSWEAAASQIPDAAIAEQGNRSLSWRDADRRAECLASSLLDGRSPGGEIDDSRCQDATDQMARGDR